VRVSTVDTEMKNPYPILDSLIVTFKKIPKRIFDRSSRGLNALELILIDKIISNLNLNDQQKIKSQLDLINYVDRGPVNDCYQSFFSRISGLNTAIIFGPLLDNKSEHKVGNVVFTWRKTTITASLFFTNGRIISLECSQDVSLLAVLPHGQILNEIDFLT
jgi:hypothetical protein